MESEILNKIKETITPKKKTIDAKGAYTLSRYGQKLTEEEIYQRSIDDIGNLIVLKSQSGETSVLYEFDNTFVNMKENISKYFNDLGFLVITLDEEICKSIKSPKLLISWER